MKDNDPMIELYKNDLTADLDIGATVAIDTETLGLNPLRDRLCLLQLSTGDGNAHLIQFDGTDYRAPNLKKILTDTNVTKIFHFARFDIAVIWHYLDALCTHRLLYENSVAANPDVYRQTRPSRHMRRIARGRDLEAATAIRLGCKGTNPGTETLCGFGCPLPAPAKGGFGAPPCTGRPRPSGPSQF